MYIPVILHEVLTHFCSQVWKSSNTNRRESSSIICSIKQNEILSNIATSLVCFKSKYTASHSVTDVSLKPFHKKKNKFKNCYAKFSWVVILINLKIAKLKYHIKALHFWVSGIILAFIGAHLRQSSNLVSTS